MYARASWAGQYSPRTMGYRTWFYVAFVCAYACFPCGDRTGRVRCGRAPSGSRSRRGRSLVRSSCPLPRVLRARGPGLDCAPLVGSLHSSVDRTAAGLRSGCRSCEKQSESGKFSRHIPHVSYVQNGQTLPSKGRHVRVECIKLSLLR